MRRVEGRVDPLAERGKGKHAAGPGPGTGEGNEDGGEDGEGADGPLVIFSCRHLYHRDCLVAIGRPSRLVTGAGATSSSACVGHTRFFHPDGSGWVPSCPVCT